MIDCALFSKTEVHKKEQKLIISQWLLHLSETEGFLVCHTYSLLIHAFYALFGNLTWMYTYVEVHTKYTKGQKSFEFQLALSQEMIRILDGSRFPKQKSHRNHTNFYG